MVSLFKPSCYGRDLKGETLLDAIRACDVPGVERIRLGSLEPVIVTEDFVSALQEEKKVCPQFHLALQSGSDTVLKRMRRRYTTDEFRRACRLLRDAFPGCAITTDVISGFPGETEEEFMQSLQFCREIGFARMHVFPYSARQGTPAAKMPGQVQKAIREERARALIAAGNELALAFGRDQIGQVKEVLCEEMVEGLSQGYTREYMLCRFEGGESGKTYPIRIEGLAGDGLSGRIIAE